MKSKCKCPVCGKTFTTQRTHARHGTVRCSGCGEVFEPESSKGWKKRKPEQAPPPVAVEEPAKPPAPKRGRFKIPKTSRKKKARSSTSPKTAPLSPSGEDSPPTKPAPRVPKTETATRETPRKGKPPGTPSPKPALLSRLIKENRLRQPTPQQPEPETVVSKTARQKKQPAGPTPKTTTRTRSAKKTQPTHQTPRSETMARLPELHCMRSRMHVLRRMQECLDAGMLDPELLYSGARYATSLRLTGAARRFLDPLSAMLHHDGKPAPAFFPVGLLYLQTLEEGEELEKIRSELADLAQGHEHLERALAFHAPDPSEMPAGSPHAVLGSGIPPAVTTDPNDTLTDVARLASEAATSYRNGDLRAARTALESILLVDGDQPDALRNLIMVASEQHDIQAYLGYWRRFVKVLLWRVMRGDRAEVALQDLSRFYRSVATVSDREFTDPLPKIHDHLVQPGLLSQWTEAHAALIWLEGNREVSVTAHAPRSETYFLGFPLYWFRVYYPEFAPYVQAGTNGHRPAIPWGRKATCALPFDPRQRLLTRFAEWSRLQFALGKGTPEHTDTVVALAGFALRIPTAAYVKELQEVLAEGKLDPAPFRRAWREVCTLPFHMKVQQILGDGEGEEGHNWAGLASFLDASAIASGLCPTVRMMLAFALCRTERQSEGLIVACEAFPEMTAEDWENRNAQVFWSNVIRANLSQATSAESEVELAIEGIREEIQNLPDSMEGAEPKREALEEVEKALRQLRVRKLIDSAIEASQKLVADDDFEGARKRIQDLPNAPSEVADLKQKLLGQINDVEKQSHERQRVQDMVDEAIKRSQQLVKEGNFDSARRKVHGLPNSPAQIAKLRKDLLRQIDEAETQSRESQRVSAMVDVTVERTKEMVQEGDFDGARRAVRDLPGSQRQVAQLKENLLEQIDGAETQSREGQRISAMVDQTIEKTQRLVKEGRFDNARREVRDLPSSPAKVAQLKKSLLEQIDQAEKQSRESRRVRDMVDPTIEKTKALVQKGDFSGARRAVRGLPTYPAEIAKLRDSLLKQVDGAEEQAKKSSQINAVVDGVIEKTKALVQKGKYSDARRAVERMPSTPTELKKIKSNLLDQIRDVERQADKAKSENADLLRKLKSRNVDMAEVGKVARDNNVDMSNPLQLNGFFKAVLKQL